MVLMPDTVIYEYMDSLAKIIGEDAIEQEKREIQLRKKQIGDTMFRVAEEPYRNQVIRSIIDIRNISVSDLITNRRVIPLHTLLIYQKAVCLLHFKDQWEGDFKKEKKVRDILLHPIDSLSFLYEAEVAHNFSIRNYEVNLNTLDSHDPPDISISKGSEVILDIECKYFQSGSGLKIHDKDFASLITALDLIVKREMIGVSILFENRLEPEYISEIVDDVEKMLLAKSTVIECENYSINLDYSPSSCDYQIIGEKMEKTVSNFDARPHIAILGVGKDVKGYIICGSKKQNRIKQKILYEVNKLTTNKKKKVPLLLSIHIPEKISDEELEKIGQSDFGLFLGASMKPHSVKNLSAISLSFYNRQPFSGDEYLADLKLIVFKNDSATYPLPAESSTWFK